MMNLTCEDMTERHGHMEAYLDRQDMTYIDRHYGADVARLVAGVIRETYDHAYRMGFDEGYCSGSKGDTV